MSDLDDPEFPCRIMPTRHCPNIYDAVCGDDRPCARFESNDETPWLPELGVTPVRTCRCAECVERFGDSHVHTGIYADPADTRTFKFADPN